MVECPTTKNIPPEKNIFEARLKEQITEYSRRKEFKSIPRNMRRVASKAAYQALLMPRLDLYEKVLELDREAAEAKPDSGAYQDNKRSNPLDEYRNRKKSYYERKNVFNDVQQSTYLTRLDRMLIASRNVVVNLFNQSGGVSFDEVVQRDDFRAAHKLCMNMVAYHFRSLPTGEQRDPYMFHDDEKPSNSHLRRRVKRTV